MCFYLEHFISTVKTFVIPYLLQSFIPSEIDHVVVTLIQYLHHKHNYDVSFMLPCKGCQSLEIDANQALESTSTDDIKFCTNALLQLPKLSCSQNMIPLIGVATIKCLVYKILGQSSSLQHNVCARAHTALYVCSFYTVLPTLKSTVVWQCLKCW